MNTSFFRVEILAGMPSLPAFTADSGKFPYPDTTVDIVKILRERSLEVSFEHSRDQRQYASLNAADIWLPIIQVTHELLVSIDGHLFADIIIDALGHRQNPLISIARQWSSAATASRSEEFAELPAG
jgi:hypothetical protein